MNNNKRSAAQLGNHDNDDNAVWAKISRLEAQVDTLTQENEQLKVENSTLKSKVNEWEGESDDDDEDDDESVCDGSAWSKKYFLLKQYKQENGNCKVPQSHKQLGIWVKGMRAGLRKKTLAQERIDKLNKIGFYWGRDFPEPATWEDRFVELKKYHLTFGHVNIHVESDPALRNDLAKWVVEQRKQGKRLQKTKPSAMTLEQYKRLDALGFKWKAPKSRRS